MVPEGDGYDSTTGDSVALHPFTGKRYIPRNVHGIASRFHARAKEERRHTGSLAGLFARATGSSVPVPDGGTSDENNGIIVSELHRNIVPPDSDLSSSGEGPVMLSPTDKERVAISATTPRVADMAPICWNLNDLNDIYDLPENAVLNIDGRKITVAGPLISSMILLRSAQELFPAAPNDKFFEIRVLIMHQIRKFANTMNRGESKNFPEFNFLRATGRKILRRMVRLYMAGLIDTQARPLSVIDNLAKTAMIVHDLFAQDDAAFEDALHVRTTVGLCELIQNQCKRDDCDLCMESLALRIGDFEQVIMDRKSMSPDGSHQWFGQNQVSDMLGGSASLESFACLCAILWRPAFDVARDGDNKFSKDRAIGLFLEAAAVLTSAIAASCCFNLPVSPAVVAGRDSADKLFRVLFHRSRVFTIAYDAGLTKP